MPRLRSDLGAALALVALIGLMGLWVVDRQGHPEGVAACRFDRERSDGRVAVLTLAQVLSVGADRYVVRKGLDEYLVLGDPGELAPGVEVSIGGTCADGGMALVQSWTETHPWRKAKMGLGLVGMALLGLILALTMAPGRRGITLRG